MAVREQSLGPEGLVRTGRETALQGPGDQAVMNSGMGMGRGKCAMHGNSKGTRQAESLLIRCGGILHTRPLVHRDEEAQDNTICDCQSRAAGAQTL